jgi:hypothetical protein
MREQRKDVIEFSRDVNVAPATVYQWLDGTTKKISKRTIRLWLLDPEIPDYVKAMARELAGERVQPSGTGTG